MRSLGVVVIGGIYQRPPAAVVEVLDYMRKRRIALDDLIQIGGQDLGTQVDKARHVEKCWDLMARLSVNFIDLERALEPETAS